MKRQSLIVIIIALLVFVTPATATLWHVSLVSLSSTTPLDFSSSHNYSIAFGNNGTEMYIIYYTSKAHIKQYHLSTPYEPDLSNLENTITVQSGGSNGLRGTPSFSDDGKHMYFSEYASGQMQEWNLQKAWDIGTKTSSYTITLGNGVSGQGSTDLNMSVSVQKNGQYLYIADDGHIYQYQMSTPYDIRTATPIHTKAIGGSYRHGLYVRSDGHFLYTSGNSNGIIKQYEFNTTWDASTLTQIESVDLSFQASTVNGVFFDSAGARMYTVGYSPSEIEVWGLADGSASGFIRDADGKGIPNASTSSNGQTVTTNQTGYYKLYFDNGNYTITANKTSYIENTTNVTISNVDLTNVNISLFKTGVLELDINPFMQHGSNQRYQVYTNISGVRKDVTTNATVSTANSSVVSVNQTQQKLFASDILSINRRTSITAVYHGKTISKNVTVANRTIDNIGIMPPSQYIGAFLGLDEPGTVAGIGSSIEWLYLAIALGAFVSWESRNEWLGVGTITVLVILFWVVGHVSLGVTMISTFFGLFALYQLQGIPSRSDTNVNP